jgi:hypothetical protein
MTKLLISMCEHWMFMDREKFWETACIRGTTWHWNIGQLCQWNKMTHIGHHYQRNNLALTHWSPRSPDLWHCDFSCGDISKTGFLFPLALTHWPAVSVKQLGTDTLATKKSRSIALWLFFWGCIKDRIFIPPRSVRVNDVASVDEDMLRCVWNEFDYSLGICRATKGSYIEHL